MISVISYFVIVRTMEYSLLEILTLYTLTFSVNTRAYYTQLKMLPEKNNVLDKVFTICQKLYACPTVCISVVWSWPRPSNRQCLIDGDCLKAGRENNQNNSSYYPNRVVLYRIVLPEPCAELRMTDVHNVIVSPVCWTKLPNQTLKTMIIIITLYCSIVRTLLQYACLVWHSDLTKNCQKNIERVQKRC